MGQVRNAVGATTGHHDAAPLVSVDTRRRRRYRRHGRRQAAGLNDDFGSLLYRE